MKVSDVGLSKESIKVFTICFFSKTTKVGHVQRTIGIIFAF